MDGKQNMDLDTYNTINRNKSLYIQEKLNMCSRKNSRKDPKFKENFGKFDGYTDVDCRKRWPKINMH